MIKINCYRTLIITCLFTIASGSIKLNAQCTENFETVTAPALPTGWTANTLVDCAGSNAWVTSLTTPISGTRSAFVTAPGCVSDEVLYSRYFYINTSGAQLTFSRKHGLEVNWDGLVLEISINGGSFLDILTAGGSFVSGGYTHTLFFTDNPIGGRQAWSGTVTATSSVVNLPSSANGQLVVFRWRRGTDFSGSGTGVFIDNISITGCTTSTCSENFNAVTVPNLPAGWFAVTETDCAESNPWATTNTVFDSSPNSAFVNDPLCISDEYLYSSLFQIISPSAQLTFRRNNNLELGYDGLVLEISIDGASFTDILTAGCTFVAGPYDQTISNCCGNPLTGRLAWTGNSGGWVTTTINLPASAVGKIIILRWRRGTDSSIAATGAYIDGISISGSVCNTSCAGTITVSPTNGSICTGPQLLTATGAGPVYSWYRNHVLIGGASSATYSATLEGIYYTKSLISGCLVTSNITIIGPGSVAPILTGGDIYCIGTSVSIGMVETRNDQSYTWRQNGNIVHTIPVGSGGGSQYMNFSMDASKAGVYQVETVKTGCLPVMSNIINVGAPVITGLTLFKNCQGETIVKWNRVVPYPEFQLYQFEMNSNPTPPSFPGSTSDSAWTYNFLTPGSQYYFHVRSICSPGKWGAWVTLPVMTPPLLGLVISSGSICEVPTELTASGGSGVYSWYLDGNPIGGATGSTYVANSFGTYSVSSNNGTCDNISGDVVLTGLVPPSLEGSGVYCTGSLADMRVFTENEQSYEWYRIGNPIALRTVPIGGGGGNQSLAIAVNSSTEGVYEVITARPGCPALQSGPAYVDRCRVTFLELDYTCPTSVKFKWTSASNNFEYIVNQVNTPTGTVMTTFSHEATFSPLLPSTLYYIHVQGEANNPGGTGYCGAWTTISFTTPPGTSPPASAVWTGAVSTVWTNPANWQCGMVPGITTEVVVDGGLTNYPVISANTAIKKITVNPGASVNVNPGVVLTIVGN